MLSVHIYIQKILIKIKKTKVKKQEKNRLLGSNVTLTGEKKKRLILQFRK